MNLFASKQTQRLANVALTALLMVSTMTASVPFIFSQKVNAAPGISYSTVALAQSDWAVDRTVPSGGWTVDGTQVVLNVDQVNSSTAGEFYKTEGVSKTLAVGTDTIKADLFVAADWSSKPSLRAGLWGVARDGSHTDLSYPIIEYAHFGGYTGWRVWDSNTGVWHNVVAATNVEGFNTVEIVSSKNTGNYDFYVNNQKVYSYAAEGYTTFTAMILNNYNVGTGIVADNYTVTWKNFTTGKLPVVAQCSDSTTLQTSYLGNWNTLETRTQGSNTLTTQGLAIKTVENPAGNGSPDQRKAAGYYATDFALANAGSETTAQRMDYTTISGVAPGLQMVADFDNDGSIDGILVGESVYGNDWWLTGSAKQFAQAGAPQHGGGFGSINHGTLDGWLEAFPNARIKAIGYSLGSGVTAEGVISSLKFGCVNYTFALDTTAPSKPSLALPSNGSAIGTNNFDFDWNDSIDANPVTYEFHSSQDPSRDSSGILNGGNIWSSGTLQTSNIHSSGAPDGYWFYQVRAKDAAGNYSPWSDIWSVAIDTQSPTVPVITYPGGWHQEVTNIQWNASSDTTPITYNVYEGSHPNDVNTLIAADLTGTSFAHTFATGPHQIRVVAKDSLGHEASSQTIGFQVIGTPQIVTPTNGLVLNLSNGSSYTTSWTSVYGVGGTKNYEVEYGIDANGNGAIETSELQSVTVDGETLARTQNFAPNVQAAMTIRVRAVYNIPIGGTDKGPWSTLVNYSRDSIKPAAPVVTATGANSGDSISNGSVEVLWTKPSSDTVKYDYKVWTNIAASDYNSEGAAYIERGITGNARSGEFSEGQGTYFIQVRAIDAAGNASDWSPTFAVTYDFVAPVLTINQPVAVTVGDKATLTGSVRDLSPIGALTFTVNGAPYAAKLADMTIAENGDWTLKNLDTALFAAGNPVIVTATVTDAANNTRTSLPVSLTLNAAVVSPSIPTGTTPETVTTTAGIPQTPTQALVAVVTPTITGAGSVLGATDNAAADKASAAAVKGATDDKTTGILAATDVNNNDGKIFGLTWYWWILILAGLAIVAGAITGAIRRRNADA